MQPLKVSSQSEISTAAKSGTRVPSRREQAAVFLVSLCFLTVGAAWRTFYLGILEGDALSRTYNAAVVLYDPEPRLANLGFIWPPLPSLLQIPLVLFRPLLTDGFAGSIVSATAGALGLAMLNRILARYTASRSTRLLLLAIYQGNVLMLYYSINGMTEMLMIALSLFCWLQFQQLYDELPHRDGVAQVALMGLGAALAFMTRYEAVSLGLALFLVLLLTLITRGQRVGIVPGLLLGRRRVSARGAMAIEAYSLAYLAPLAYAVFLWLFFNWAIMGNPLHFMFGPGSNAQQTAAFVASNRVFASMKGNALESLVYVANACAVLFPAFYAAMVLLLILAVRRRDTLAASMMVVAASFPAFQAAMLTQGQSFGLARFFLYVIPFSVLGLAHAFGRLAVPTTGRGRDAVLVVLIAISSCLTARGIGASGLRWEHEAAFLSAVLHNAGEENFAREKEIARYLRALPSDDLILADDLQSDHIILFTQQFERFVTTRNRHFDDIASDPVGRVEYLLVPNVGPDVNRIARFHPNVFETGARYLELEREFLGQDDMRWRLYRVVSPPNGRP